MRYAFALLAGHKISHLGSRQFQPAARILSTVVERVTVKLVLEHGDIREEFLVPRYEVAKMAYSKESS